MLNVKAVTSRAMDVTETQCKDGPVRDVILDSINEGVFAVDANWRITFFNKAAERLTGLSREEAIGQPCRSVLKANICEGACALRRTIETGTPLVGQTITILDAKGRRRSVGISTAVLRDCTGAVIGGVEILRDLSVLEELRKEVSRAYSFEDIVSRNHAMRRLFDIIPEVAESPSTVLIYGESGTGKELVARALHQSSSRADGPFVAVNCGALPDTLLESELFGYRAGAFTDARRSRPGRIAAAQGGTLFLDEIGDVSQALQVRLLRFLQEKTYEPLGSVEPITADVRVIAATNKRLEDLVEEGSFRSDLFYRINVVNLELPPLRDRKEDIPLLVDHFITRHNGLQSKTIQGISDRAIACLMAHSYPGNIRELENAIERAFIFCHEGEIIEECHLPVSLRPAHVQSADIEQIGSLKQLEAAYLVSALQRNNWNRSKTARELGMHKTTLYRKMKALGIKGPSRRGRP